MNGLFWNSNGMRDHAKPMFLLESVEYHLDFIAISESKRADFNQIELAHFCANRDFKWSWTQPRGRSGGILVGVNLEKIIVQDIVLGNFFLKFKLKNKVDNFEWTLIAVYGAAQEDEKDFFLQELVQACTVEKVPFMVGGDFNIIRSPQEKK
jgi:predicted cupin superfamily sugar epimerase